MGGRITGELESATLHGPPLDREIQLPLDRALELASQRRRFVHSQAGEVAFHQLREVLDDVQVGLDDFGDVRPAHLEGHGPAVAKDRPVDLRNRGRGDRDRLDGNEDFGERARVFLDQDRFDLVERKRSDVAPQRRQLVRIGLRQQIGSGAEQLPQLHESRPQVFADEPKSARPVLGGNIMSQRNPLDRANNSLEVQRGHHILITVSHQATSGSADSEEDRGDDRRFLESRGIRLRR